MSQKHAFRFASDLDQTQPLAWLVFVHTEEYEYRIFCTRQEASDCALEAEERGEARPVLYPMYALEICTLEEALRVAKNHRPRPSPQEEAEPAGPA